ncbi:hypothetical protein ACLMJK_000037 [Lecanora helva]
MPWPKIQFSDTGPRLFDAVQRSKTLSSKARPQGFFTRQSRSRGSSETTARIGNAFRDRRVTHNSSPQDETNAAVASNHNTQRRPYTEQSGPTSERCPLQNYDSETTLRENHHEIQPNNHTEFHNGLAGNVSHLSNPIVTIERAKSPINQGHIASLCSYMRLQQAEGILIPAEFSSCTVHPAPVHQKDEKLSEPDFTALDDFEDNLTPAKRLKRNVSIASSHKSTSTAISSSTYVESSPSTQTSRHSEESSSISPTSIKPQRISHDTSEEEFEDPFLHLGKAPNTTTEILTASPKPHQTSSAPTFSEAEESEEADPFLYLCKHLHATTTTSLTPRTRSRRPRPHPQPSTCTCTSHTCTTYLSSRPSAHCHSCRLPYPQPEIISALLKIQKAQKKGKMRSDEFRRLVGFVRAYEREMERRCSKGVWWEGWRVVGELQGRGSQGEGEGGGREG